MNTKMKVEITLVESHLEEMHAVIKQIIAKFGGATAVPAIGYWVGESGEVEEEDVCVVAVYADDTEENRWWFEMLAVGYRSAAEQEAVLYVINSTEVHLIKE